MIASMPRPRPPHLHRETTRHGKTVWYVRVGAARASALPTSARQSLKANIRPPSQDRPARKRAARPSIAWRGCWTATGKLRNGPTCPPPPADSGIIIFVHVIDTAGDTNAAKITQATIHAGKERRAKTPAQARNFLDAMRGLFKWATKAKHVKIDPTIGVENPPRKNWRRFHCLDRG
jgi:hypothetical protein